jgi:hypothetical protein
VVGDVVDCGGGSGNSNVDGVVNIRGGSANSKTDIIGVSCSEQQQSSEGSKVSNSPGDGHPWHMSQHHKQSKQYQNTSTN